MKKKIIVLGLVAILGVGSAANAAPHNKHGGMHHRPPHHHKMPYAHRHHHPSIGISFSTSMLPYHRYWRPYYVAPPYTPYYYNSYAYPSVYFGFGF